MGRPEETPGWYPDPYEQAVERHWTGDHWGSETRPRAKAAVVATPAPAAVEPELAGMAERQTLKRRTLKRNALWPTVSVVAGSVMAVGSFLPWVTVSGTFGQHASVRGTSDGSGGWISFAFGLAIVAGGIVSFRRPRWVATVVVDLAALGGCVLTIYEFAHLTSESGVLSANNSVGIYEVGVGPGLGLVAVAAVVALIGAAGITGRDARALLEP
ncbi:MAG: DUF2510 domain-containing protein [Actinomycetota bacterium]|nr:DUF2510 domain-containing protein [Actinomycetota bacterium]